VVQATEPVVEPPADAQGVQEPVPGAEQPSASDQPAPQLAPATVSAAADVSAAAEAEAESPETAPAEAAEAPSVTPVEPAQPTAADATAMDGQEKAPDPRPEVATVPATTSEETIAEAEPPKPEEVRFEDVWRPRRRHDGQRPDRRRHRGHHPGGQRPAQQERQQQAHR